MDNSSAKNQLALDSVFGFEYKKEWDYENGFYLTSHISRIAKAVSHWELYKSITSLPGSVIECGVYKGASLVRFATFRNILENNFSREIIGFDAFGSFPKTNSDEDNKFISRFEEISGEGIQKHELENCFIKKGVENITLIEGNICDTIPAYVEANPHLKIALLHIDVDVYQPTECCLKYLYDKVVKGGIIVLDDYGAVGGETKAVDDFLASRKVDCEIKKVPYYCLPCYMIKQ